MLWFRSRSGEAVVAVRAKPCYARTGVRTVSGTGVLRETSRLKGRCVCSKYTAHWQYHRDHDRQHRIHLRRTLPGLIGTLTDGDIDANAMNQNSCRRRCTRYVPEHCEGIYPLMNPNAPCGTSWTSTDLESLAKTLCRRPGCRNAGDKVGRFARSWCLYRLHDGGAAVDWK
jgi:hypothetical protein